MGQTNTKAWLDCLAGFLGYGRRKKLCYSAGKIMEFIFRIRNMQIYVTCKFETLIFKSSQVIKYYVMFAFLFVQTVGKRQNEAKEFQYPYRSLRFHNYCLECTISKVGKKMAKICFVVV